MTRTDYNLPVLEDTDAADLNKYTSELANALKVQIDRFGNPLTFRGVVATLNDLPNNASAGDIYNVLSINKNYCYSGTEWLEYSDVTDNSCHKMITDEYDCNQTYSVGDYCIYNNTLYRCIAVTTGIWDSTKWIATQIVNEIENFKVPTGGSTGQILVKKSDDDNDVEWQTNIKVVDNLTSTSQTDALSANQGKVLDSKITMLNSKLVYSTTETVIGTCMGKPLYRKMLIAPATEGLNVAIPHSISNLKSIIHQEINCTNSAGNTYPQHNDIYDLYIKDTDAQNVWCKISGAFSDWSVIVTLEYTKTTD